MSRCRRARGGCPQRADLDPDLQAEQVSMFFRFGAALVLVVLVALTGTALETQNLAMKRALSQQQYRLDVLVETQTSLRLESQRLGTPAKLFESLERGDRGLTRVAKPQRTDARRVPHWNGTGLPDDDSRHTRSVPQGDSNRDERAIQ
jgi:hypothetical protein